MIAVLKRKGGISLNVRNCRKCGKIFNYVSGAPICPMCKDALEKKFMEVKEYIRENSNCTVQDVVEHCEVEQQQIHQWIREERLELKGGTSGVFCEKCGTPIHIGRFCEKCKAEMANTFSLKLEFDVLIKFDESRPGYGIYYGYRI